MGAGAGEHCELGHHPWDGGQGGAGDWHRGHCPSLQSVHRSGPAAPPNNAHRTEPAIFCSFSTFICNTGTCKLDQMRESAHPVPHATDGSADSRLLPSLETALLETRSQLLKGLSGMRSQPKASA